MGGGIYRILECGNREGHIQEMMGGTKHGKSKGLGMEWEGMEGTGNGDRKDHPKNEIEHT